MGRILQAAVLNNLRRNYGFPKGRIGCTTQKTKDQGERNLCSDYTTGLGYPGFESPSSITDFALVHNDETRSGTQVASCSNGNGALFRE